MQMRWLTQILISNDKIYHINKCVGNFEIVISDLKSARKNLKNTCIYIQHLKNNTYYQVPKIDLLYDIKHRYFVLGNFLQ